MSKLIFIQDIDLDHSPIVRASLNEDVVEEYADIYRQKKIVLPPVQLFTEDGKHFLLADGMHRVNAIISLGQKMIPAEINKGGYEEALKFALLANDRHGLRRTAQDKRRCVREAIKQWPKHADATLGGLCGVDPKTVKVVRAELEEKGTVKAEPLRTTSDGRKYPAKLAPKEASGKSEIVQKKAEPKVVVLQDANGKAIPQFAVQFWNRAEEVKEMCSTLDVLTRALKVFQKNEDLMYGEVNISGAIADLNRVWTNIACAVPFAVCTQCQGQPQAQTNGECRMCKGRGLISKFRWDTVVPAEIKRMAKK